MNTTDDLYLIKKAYGEQFMHFCRDNFSTILEEPGLLYKIITSKFYPSHHLYDDLKNNNAEYSFRNYILDQLITDSVYKEVTETPAEILDEVGYNLFHCTTPEEVDYFKKYYAPGEKLCTFKDSKGRLEKCHVFFAVKKDVNKIMRKDFPEPERQDLYGTSVISIQFTKDDSNILSIKNRYNELVVNSDATFSNNLDNIRTDLTEAFNKTYNLKCKVDTNTFELKKYVKAQDGKYYKYNIEKDNIYYCPDNIIIDNFKVKKYDKSKYIVMDYFILDLQTKHEEIINGKKQRINQEKEWISLYENCKHIDDCFPKYSFCKDPKINIEVDRIKNTKTVTIDNKVEIILNDLNQIIGYKNPNIIEVDNNFLIYNKTMKSIELENAVKLGDNCLNNNTDLKTLNMNNLKIMGNNCFYNNLDLMELYLPNLREIGDNCFYYNEVLAELFIPLVNSIGDCFCYYNQNLYNLYLANLTHLGNNCFNHNNLIEELYMPILKDIPDNFLYDCKNLRSIDIRHARSIGNYVFCHNRAKTYIDINEVEKIGKYFMSFNNKLKVFNAEKLLSIGECFLETNNCIEKFNAPNVQNIENGFFGNKCNVCAPNKLMGIDDVDAYRTNQLLKMFNKLLEERNDTKVKVKAR